MSRATLISRIVFVLLVAATFTAFFAAQRLKRTDPLVNSVNIKRYVSPNNDGLRDRARLRFRTKQADVVTVEVIDSSGDAVRTLADAKRLKAGPHRFQWNGRSAPNGDARGEPVPDGAYRVRITMRNAGRTFIPDKYFVVDTQPPKLTAEVVGEHDVSLLADRPRPVTVRFTGVEPSRRVEFLVYRVSGSRTGKRPVAIFANQRGKDFGRWDLNEGTFSQRREPCFGRLATRGAGTPAPAGNYVIVVRACDAAGNIGYSSTEIPPERGSPRGASGVTLTGVQLAPPPQPALVGTVASFSVTPPSGGYRYRLTQFGGETVARGRARGATLRFEIPRTPAGLYELRVEALRPVRGDAAVARTPVAVRVGGKRELLVVQPSIAWQLTNPVDVDGDGFGDPFQGLPPGEQLRVSTGRKLVTPLGPPGWRSAEGALADFLSSDTTVDSFAVSTDFALAASADPLAALKEHKAVLFAGDERWITPQLGTALRRYVEQGGRVAFFAPDAFRRTVRISASSIGGPSDRRERDVFGEAIDDASVAPAPLVAFADEIGLLQGPTGLFVNFEQSRSRARAAEVLTAAGREEGKPALVAYRLGKGLVIRVGVPGWQAELLGSADLNVAYTTRAIIAELSK